MIIRISFKPPQRSNTRSSAASMASGAFVFQSVIVLPQLPSLLSNWAAIVPLVVHVASEKADYTTTGEVVLAGELVVSLFPKLGTYHEYTLLLTRGDKYLDLVGSRGGSALSVWDVRWGATFPCANGAACSAVLDQLLKRLGDSEEPMPESLPQSIAYCRIPGLSNRTTKRSRKGGKMLAKRSLIRT